MAVRVITPPLPILNVAEVKLHLRIEAEDEESDTYLEGLIAAAQGWIDGPAGWLGRAVGVQKLEWSGSSWPTSVTIGLPYPPLLEITTVIYVDPAGVQHEWPVPEPLSWDDLPTLRGDHGDLRIRYWAGYGTRIENPDVGAAPWMGAAPAPIKQATLLLVGQWFATREAINIGNIVNQLPFAVEALLSPFRVWR